MQNRSKIIIVGAGITGASTAYHLAKLGWNGITVLVTGPVFVKSVIKIYIEKWVWLTAMV